MFKVGQWIYAIEVEEDYWDEAEVNGLLFMAECEDYIIACSEYAHCENNFTKQLREMCNESAEDYGVELYLLKKNLCFETQNQAENYLVEMRDYE